MAAINRRQQLLLLLFLYKKQRAAWFMRRKKIVALVSAVLQRRRNLSNIKAYLSLLCAEIEHFQSPQPRIRSCRRLPRNQGWWDLIWDKYDDDRFKQTFRVSRGTFEYILSKIRHKIEKEVTTELPISPILQNILQTCKR